MFDQVTTDGLGYGQRQFENNIHGGIENAILDLILGCKLSQSVCNIQIHIGGQRAGPKADGAQCDAGKDESIVCLPGNASFAVIDNRRKWRTGTE